MARQVQVRKMFQEMDESLYEDCRLRFEDEEVQCSPFEAAYDYGHPVVRVS